MCSADCTVQRGCQKALIVLRVPVSAGSQGTARTLQQGEVMGLRLGEPGNGARVSTVFLARFQRCGWPAHVGSDGGSESKTGLVDPFLEAPKRASWISDVSHCVANALQHSSAKLALFQQVQRLCTRMRQRLQQTRWAFVLPPQARAQGRLLRASRQAEWGLRTIASWETQERAAAPEAAALAQARRGLKSLKLFLMTVVRNTTCLNQGRKIVTTQGWRAESMQACQETLGHCPVWSPLRNEVRHSWQHSGPIVEASDSPLLGARAVIESLMGQAKQRLEAHGRSELHTSILLIPCMGRALTPDLVAEARTTVRVQDVTTWVAENVGATMPAKRRRAFPRSQPQKPGTEPAEPLADTG